MNRFKKEIRKRGFKLESDLPCLPYELKGDNRILLDSIFVNSERAEIVVVFDDGNPHF